MAYLTVLAVKPGPVAGLPELVMTGPNLAVAVDSTNLQLLIFRAGKLSCEGTAVNLGGAETLSCEGTGAYSWGRCPMVIGLSMRPLKSFNSLNDTFCPIFCKERHFWQNVLFLTRFHKKMEN